jgi:hypothetical protein
MGMSHLDMKLQFCILLHYLLKLDILGDAIFFSHKNSTAFSPLEVINNEAMAIGISVIELYEPG